MRVGVLLPMTESMPDVARMAANVEACGFDSVWLEEQMSPPGWPNPLMVVPAASARTDVIRIGVVASGGGAHPLYVAEEVAAADHVSRGRLILVLRQLSEGESACFGIAPEERTSRFRESLEVINRCLGARPFSFDGRHWRIPGRLSQHPGVQQYESIQLTPAPTQIALHVWTATSDLSGFLGPDQLRLATVLDIGQELRNPRLLSEQIKQLEVQLAVLRLEAAGFDDTLARIARQVLPRLRAVRLPPVIERAMDDNEGDDLWLGPATATEYQGD